MSNAATKWAWEQLQVSGSEKLVLLRLADHAHPDGTNIRPGLKSLATFTGISERQVRRYIQGFLDQGLIAFESNEHGGRGKVPTYFIPAVKADADDHLSNRRKGDTHDPLSIAPKADASVPLSDEKEDTHDTQRRTPMTQKGDMGDTTLKGLNRHEPSTEPSTRARTRARDGGQKTNGKLAEQFDRFWSVYPRREKKQAALKAFTRINPDDELLERMIHTLELAKLSRQWRKDDGQFIPHPATWLNDGQWDDELTPASSVETGPPGVELLPGETAEQTGPGSWELTGPDGMVRRIDPTYCGVIFDERIHSYSDISTFYDAVREAKARQAGSVTHDRS
jgi:hypothetical protein